MHECSKERGKKKERERERGSMVVRREIRTKKKKKKPEDLVRGRGHFCSAHRYFD